MRNGARMSTDFQNTLEVMLTQLITAADMNSNPVNIFNVRALDGLTFANYMDSYHLCQKASVILEQDPYIYFTTNRSI
jgi:hypothetical protein